MPGLQGALSGTVAAAVVLVATISPKERLGYTLGMLQTGIYIGVSVGPAFGGLLSDLFGYRVTFLATAVFLLVAAGIVMRFVREESIRSGPAGSFVKSVIPDFSPLAHSPGLIVLVLVSGGLQIATSTVAPILPLFIQSISPQATKVATMTGLILGGSAIAAALSSAGLGRVSHRIGYERLLAFCLSGAVLVFLPQAFVRNPIQLLVLRVIGGAMIGGSEPSIQRHDRYARRQKPTRNDLRVEHEHELGWCRRRAHDRSHIIRELRLRLSLLCRDGGPSSFSHRGTHCQETRAARGSRSIEAPMKLSPAPRSRDRR